LSLDCIVDIVEDESATWPPRCLSEKEKK
jgi:hypothetical protein